MYGNQYKDPVNNNKDCRVGQLTSATWATCCHPHRQGHSHVPPCHSHSHSQLGFAQRLDFIIIIKYGGAYDKEYQSIRN